MSLRTNYQLTSVGFYVTGHEKATFQNGRCSSRILTSKMSESKLTNAQKARVERNRQKALLLRSSRLSNRPYPQRSKDDKSNTFEASSGTSGSSSTVSLSRVVDTGGGFLLDVEEEEELSRAPRNIVEQPGIRAFSKFCCCSSLIEWLHNF